jgi:hypothetical protein
MTQSMPQLPERALSSQAVLLRPLQDIDVFVEDSHSKEFYNALMSRVLDGLVRFFSVIPLGGRDTVEKRSENNNGPRASLYLVDGDLDWVAGEHTSRNCRLFVHQCYCIENYLFCVEAMKSVIHENSGVMSMNEIEVALNWGEFRKSLEALIPLFVEFAVAHALGSGIKTVSRGYSAVISHVRGAQPKIDEGKVMAIISDIQHSILATRSEKEYESIKSAIQARVDSLDDRLRIVSGKDFLLPMQHFEAHRVASQRMTTESLMLRLAKHCDLSQFSAIRERCVFLTTEDQFGLNSEDINQCHSPEPPPETS